ncbi:hypothetical protein [Clostridium sp. CF012]|uniref:hypothetical protein n=1 Tax=Clostridium sp. CF012 TaxID=2843319 RepID=UPI001C0E5762|nr:hypothetical protein [Clostridium sp. CF012]MBU3144632.1 hypothetical protein [Clostridium sp. CF012]
MEEKTKYYENLIDKYIYNTIISVSEIAKCLGINLSDMTEVVGFSISAVSRIRNKVKNEQHKAYDSLPYALCMLTSIDYLCIFDGIKSETLSEIKRMLFENMCEPVPLYYDADGVAHNTISINKQRWYKVEHVEGRGFVYQLKYFIYRKKQEEKEVQRYIIENELTNILKNCRIAFTLMGYKYAEKRFDEINNLIRNTYKNSNIIYLSSFISDENYYGKLRLPDKKIYMYELKSCSKEIMNEMQGDADCIIDFYSLVLEEISDNYVLLFIKNEEEKFLYKEIYKEEYQDKVIFAYYSYNNNAKKARLVLNYKDSAYIVNNTNNVLDMYDL